MVFLCLHHNVYAFKMEFLTRQGMWTSHPSKYIQELMVWYPEFANAIVSGSANPFNGIHICCENMPKIKLPEFKTFDLQKVHGWHIDELRVCGMIFLPDFWLSECKKIPAIYNSAIACQL